MFRQGDGAPPMPWANYRDASESDLVAIHRFLKSLGPRGTQLPDPLPPGTEPTTPYIDMTPRQPSRASLSRAAGGRPGLCAPGASC